MDVSRDIADLERSEELMAEVAESVRESVGTGDGICRAALAVLQSRIAEQHGLDWEPEDGTREVRSAVRELLEKRFDRDGRELEAALAEPHAIGWFHQYFGEPVRDASHRAHHRDEAKHETAGVTTQLYTPRWIADALVEASLCAESDPAPTLLDPAVGGGQMLLAAYDGLRRRSSDWGPAEVVRHLGGRDIDRRAVEVARRNLKLRAARHAGERVPEAERIIDDRVCGGDGLFELERGARVVLTNPPYMGLRSMPEDLKRRVREEFEPFHRDLYAAFIRKCHDLAESRVGILAQQTIWYLKSFRAARCELLERGDLETFLHFGPHAFASLDGEKANVVGFVQRAFGRESEGAPATFFDLRDLGGRREMRSSMRSWFAEGSDDNERRIEADPDEFSVLPGRPLAYWLPEGLKRHFEGGRRLGDVADIPGCQNKTGSNREYLREWRDVPREDLWLRPLEAGIREAPEHLEPPAGGRWIFYSKGGGYAPWWGNWQTVVDWSEEARAFYRENSTSNLLPERYRFREGICYTDFGGRTFNARWMPPGCLFDMAGPAIFPDRGPGTPSLFALLGLLNSTPVRILLNAMNPSIHYQVTDLRRLPLPDWTADRGDRLATLGRANVRDARSLAADVESSPVERGPLPTGERPERSAAEVARRLRQRERKTDRLAHQIYDLEFGAAERIGSRHRYAPDDV